MAPLIVPLMAPLIVPLMVPFARARSAFFMLGVRSPADLAPAA
ncbi:MAG: hypothetical protein AB7P03_05220 [Kofleriaceae bacterium]